MKDSKARGTMLNDKASTFCIKCSLASRRYLFFLMMLLPVSCATSTHSGDEGLLREYRVLVPKRQLAEPVWLAASTTDELGGRLSPDGKKLLYASNLKGNLDIWIKDLTTGLPERITSHVATETQPCWGPMPKQIAYVSMQNDAKGDIFLWQNGKPTPLTDRQTADAYPVFTPDGRSLLLVSGPEGQSRIEEIELKTRRREPLTGWGATHPAISPDGSYLAYTQFDEQNRGRIAVLRRADRKVWLITTGDYHAGFPTFSPKGDYLVFSRFDRGAPNQPVSTEAIATLWQVGLQGAIQASSPTAAMALAQPLTSGRSTALFPQVSASGLVFTTQRAGSLDIGLLPIQGPVPPLTSPKELLALATIQHHPWDRLLVLQRVFTLGKGNEASRALYQSTVELQELNEFDKADVLLQRLVKEGAGRHGDLAYLAQIDATLLRLIQRQHAVEQGGPPISLDEIKAAQNRLAHISLPAQPSSQIAAHLLLRQGDLYRLAEQKQEAINHYEELLKRYPSERDQAVEAKFYLGSVFAHLQDPQLLTAYYLTLFADFPEQETWLRRAAAKVLKLMGRPRGNAISPAQEIEALKALIDAHRTKPLFCAIAQRRVADLYQIQGRNDLAIRTLSAIVQNYSRFTVESIAAAFKLSELALELSERLRKEERFSEALGYYRQALAAYEQLLRRLEPGQEHYTKARAEYLRLALLEGAQLEREHEFTLAEKRYRNILQLAPDMLQAHRRLIAIGVAQGRREKLLRHYQELARKDSGSFVGYYSLGYLATFTNPLTADDLDAAEKQLQRAINLGPQNPFGHMTLGWVYEMRERHLGQVTRGWLEEAIVLYERAYNLNDGKIDVQTEADLLLNLCNTFAALGNGWKQAFEFCDKRHQLNIPFLSPITEAAYHLTFGRAATAQGKYDLAAEELERALQLARGASRDKLEAEVLSRLALNAHLQGNYELSNRYLRQTADKYQQQGRRELLSALSRSMAYNAFQQGRIDLALQGLKEAQELLKRHGAPKIESWSPIGPPGRSTAPFGFEALDESHASLAIETWALQAGKAWPDILSQLERRLENRQQAFKQRKDDELEREILQLQHHLALSHLRLGQPDQFQHHIVDILQRLEKLQTDPKLGFIPDAAIFPVYVAIALNSAEQVLVDLASKPGHVTVVRLQEELERIQRLEAIRKLYLERDQQKLLGPRLQMALWTDLALLYFHAGLRGLERPSPTKAADTPAPVSTAAEAAAPHSSYATLLPSQLPENNTSRGAKSWNDILQRAHPFTSAIRLLQQIMKLTDPEAVEAEEDQFAEEKAAADEQGTLRPLYQPLTALDRLRWQVLTGLNLAEISSALAPRNQLADHPSTELLQKLDKICQTHDLGALKFIIAVELAFRQSNLPAMQAAIDGFLARSPLLLDEDYLRQADLIRQRIFGPARRLAMEQKNLEAALAFAEQEERRAFLDDLVALPPAGRDLAAKPLERFLASAKSYRQLLAQQNPAQSEEKREAWRKKLAQLEKQTTQHWTDLLAVTPRVAELFRVPAFPLKDVAQALESGEIAVTALTIGKQAWLIALGSDGALKSVPLTPQLAEIQQRLNKQPKEVKKIIVPALSKLVSGARRIYLDLGRIAPNLRPESLLPQATIIRLATLWELVDAFAIRNLAFKDSLIVDPQASRAKALSQATGIKALSEPALDPRTINLPLEQAGLLIGQGALRFDGEEATNIRLLLHPSPEQRRQDLRLGRILGMPLRGHALLLTQVNFIPVKMRRQHVALMRLIHASGIPSIIIAEGGDAQSPMTVKLLRDLRTRLGLIDVASVVQPHVKANSTLTLFGYGGMDQERAKAFAKAELKKTVFAGAAAFNKRRLPEAVENLETALRLMTHLGEDTYLDGALLYLANSYTLLEDYARAIPKMEQLLALRARAIAEARQKGKGVLEAQAKWVQALQSMAWLRMRNAQYTEALAVNRQALDLYKEVNRPLLAQPALDQRSVIAEKKGDMKEALDYARRALQTAQQALARAPQNAQAKSTVATAASRLARILRMRFSDYRPAMTAALLALEHLPPVKVERLSILAEQIEAIQKQLPTAKGKNQTTLQARVKTLTLEKQQINTALEDRINAILEISRIQSARGDYQHAIEEAEKALKLAQQSGLPLQDVALLEIANNLYYMGSLDRALAVAVEGLAQAKNNRLRQIQFLNAQGSINAGLGRSAAALKALNQALSIATNLKNPTEIAASRNNLGNALRLMGRFKEAKQQFEQALAIDQRQDDQLGMAFDHANLGLVEELLGQTRVAQTEFEQSLRMSQRIGAPLNELKALAGLGRLSLAAKQGPKALNHFKQGLSLATRLGLRNWQWRFHLLAGRALRLLGQLPVAQAELAQGLIVVEQSPPRQSKALGTPQIEEEPEDVYDELIDLWAEMNKAQEAFDLVERLHSRAMVDRLGLTRVPLAWPAAEAAIAQLSGLEVGLEAARSALDRAANPADRKLAQQEITRLEAELATKRLELARVNDKLPSLVAPDAWPLSRLKELLSAKTSRSSLILSYYPTARNLIIWTLRPPSSALEMRIVRINRRTLTDTVNQFRDGLVHFQPVNELAQKLYQWLIQPVLKTQAPDYLVVIPAGPLHVLPFAALHDGRDYVVAQRTIQYLPSLNALRFIPGASEAAGTSRISFSWAGSGQAPLTFAPREAEALALTFPDTMVLKGPTATRAQFIAEAPKAKFIHLATHATYQENQPLLSALELADKPLPVAEILGLPLKADLVILSACETGLGSLDGADGVTSLHRAFLSAGARRVVSSLFRVTDLGTALLMKHFFRHLTQLPPAAALRHAQNDLRQRFPHPAFWSGFRLDGRLD